MVITKLQGGLGNQLFQYACGKAVAIKKHTDLKLDLSSYENEQLRELNLHSLATKISLADLAEVKMFKSASIFMKLLKRNIHYKERTPYQFDPKVFRLAGNIYLDGYWQSYKYFEDCSELIRKEFQLPDPVDKVSLELLKKLRHPNTIAVHIRLGDYVNNQHTKSIHYVCTPEYYKNAMQKAREQIADAKFYVFSDDIKLAKELLAETKDTEYISPTSVTDPIHDFQLLQSASNFIISNSSFSWWAAWLGREQTESQKKKVYAPNKWLASRDINLDDLLLPDWERLQV